MSFFIDLSYINIKSVKTYLLQKTDYDNPTFVQYLDFYVANYFFENNLDNNKINFLNLYPDATAVHLYLKCFCNIRSKKNISTDFQNELLTLCNKYSLKVYFLGDTDEILKLSVRNLSNKYPNMNIMGYYNGYDFDDSKVISSINLSKIDIFFIGMGVGQQEKWLLENHNNIKSKLVVSVGGWYQYLSGNKKRAPLVLRKLYLEWLYKLIVEFPRVWQRYLIGVPQFFYRVLTKKIILKLNKNESSFY